MEARRQVFQKYLRNIINILQEKNPELCSDTCKSKLVALLPFFGWVCHSFYVGLCIFVVIVVFWLVILYVPLRHLLYVNIHSPALYVPLRQTSVVHEHPFIHTLKIVIHIITEVISVVCGNPFTCTLIFFYINIITEVTFVVPEHPFTYTLKDVIHIITEVTPVVREHPFTYSLKIIEVLCIPFCGSCKVQCAHPCQWYTAQ